MGYFDWAATTLFPAPVHCLLPRGGLDQPRRRLVITGRDKRTLLKVFQGSVSKTVYLFIALNPVV